MMHELEEKMMERMLDVAVERVLPTLTDADWQRIRESLLRAIEKSAEREGNYMVNRAFGEEILQKRVAESPQVVAALGVHVDGIAATIAEEIQKNATQVKDKLLNEIRDVFYRFRR